MAITQGTMNKAYVSAIDFLDQRDIDPKLYDQSRDRAFTDIMKIVNRTKPATMFNYHNFVNSDVFETATISGSISGSGTAQVTFAVTVGSGYPRVGDLIRTSNTNNAGKQARVQSVSLASGVATLVVRTPNNVPFYATISDTVQFGSNAFGEGSGSPASRKYPMTKYYNLIQIFKEYDKITDVQKVAKIEVAIGGDYHYLPYQLIQKVISLNANISVQMLTGVQSTTQFGDANPFLADTSNNPIQTTGGLDWYVTTYGISDSAAVLGTFDFDELDEMIDNWIANKAPMDQMGFMGSRAKRLLDKYFKNVGSSGVTSVRMILDGRTMDINVDHLSYGGAEMDFIHIPIFDHPQLFSATIAPDINGSIYWVPKDQIEVVGGGREPRMQIRYTPSPFNGANGSSNGMIKEWRTGGLSENQTNGDAVLETHWYSAQGLECLGVKHFQKYRVI